MHILLLQETDWLTRGPHTQHHIFEALSLNNSIKITVIDYDIDSLERSNSLFIKRKEYVNIHRTLKDSRVKIIRTPYLRIKIFSRITALVTNFFKILKIFRKNRPNVIFSFSMSNGSIGLILAKLFNIPFVFYYIDFLHKLIPLPYLHMIARLVTRVLFRFANLTIIQTELHKRYAINEGAPPELIRKLPDGVSFKNTIVNEEKFEILKQKYSISDDDFVIFFMGYFYPFAGLLEIINYYQEDVKSGKYNLKFVILGDGGIYKKVRKYVWLKKADWVILPGKVSFFDITEYIQLADLCLLSFEKNEITKEIIPIKIFEYMAMKKPVLTNSLPAVVLELKNKSDVIFAKNQEELIEKIGELIPKKEELKKIGEKGYKLVKEKYDWKIIVNRIKNIIKELVKKFQKK